MVDIVGMRALMLLLYLSHLTSVVTADCYSHDGTLKRFTSKTPNNKIQGYGLQIQSSTTGQSCFPVAGTPTTAVCKERDAGAISSATTRPSRALLRGSIVPTQPGMAARHWHPVSRPQTPPSDSADFSSKSITQPASYSKNAVTTL